MTILICGASGLVGREVCTLFDTKNISYIGTYHTNKSVETNMYKIDFLNLKEIEIFLYDKKVSTCIFLIVQRLTDVCENDWNQIRMTNIDMVNNTSYVCNQLNIKFIHLSTDYVFDGFTQPNLPQSPKNPLQNYGMSKFLSELKVEINCKNYCIIRTPVLYSAKSKLIDNAVTIIAKNVMDLRKNPKQEDNYSIRRPLYIKDLCEFILTAVQKDFIGTYHFFNPYTKFTKYEIGQYIAEYLNCSYDHVTPNNKSSIGLALRPYDTMLDDDKYNIYDFTFTPFLESIKECFAKFKSSKLSINAKGSVFCVFDLDGTLINSNLAHYESYKQVLQKKNNSFISLQEWNNFIDKGHILDYLNKHYSSTEIALIKQEKIQAFKIKPIEFTKNAETFLKFIIDNDINCCVVTNTDQETVEIIKNQLPLLHSIKNWVFREHYKNPKPNSECYELAKKLYYHNETYILGIEDTHVGLKALKSITDNIYIYSDTNAFLNDDCYIFNDYSVLY
jgi:dTDP-4-dehydrorhamnose reductase